MAPGMPPQDVPPNGMRQQTAPATPLPRGAPAAPRLPPAGTPSPDSEATPGRTRPSRASAPRGRRARTASVIRSRFSMPTPCSPVRQPPTSTQSFRISAPTASPSQGRRARWHRYRISGCRLPSPAWKMLATAQPEPAADLVDPARTYGSPTRDRAVHAHVVGDAPHGAEGRLAPLPDRSASSSPTAIAQVFRVVASGDRRITPAAPRSRPSPSTSTISSASTSSG